MENSAQENEWKSDEEMIAALVDIINNSYTSSPICKEFITWMNHLVSCAWYKEQPIMTVIVLAMRAFEFESLVDKYRLRYTCLFGYDFLDKLWYAIEVDDNADELKKWYEGSMLTYKRTFRKLLGIMMIMSPVPSDVPSESDSDPFDVSSESDSE